MRTSSPSDQLETLDPESGKAPRQRIKDACSAEQILEALVRADEAASADRAAVDKMLNGEPPYSPEKLREMGQSYRCNINFREGEAAIEAAVTGYLDLTNSVDVVARVVVDSGDPLVDMEKGGVLSEEFHRLITGWSALEGRRQLLVRHYVAHGVSIAYHEDDRSWEWSVSRLGDFLIQRGTESSDGEIEVAFVRKVYKPHALYRFIQNEAAAAAVGWDVEAVKKVLIDACKTGRSENDNWEALERELKSNDLNVGLSRGQEIELAHGWVAEFDGSVTHFIIQRKGNEEEFLYYRPNRYRNINQAFTVFSYGVGNGDFHSIRGLGYKIFPFVQVSNRLRSQTVDGAMVASSILLQTKDADDVQDLSLAQLGPIAILPPGLEAVPNALPNVAQNAIPVIREMSMVMESNTGNYQSRGTQPSGQERTKFEVQAQLQREAVLSVAAMSLFYIPWEQLLSEMFRRVTAKDYPVNSRGGRAVADFWIRCHKRGVSKADLKHVVKVSAVRAIGYGSPQMRTLALDEFQQLAGAMDDVGRTNLARDRVAARVGYENVDRYIPRAVARVNQDAKNANFENAIMQQGAATPVYPDDPAITHLEVHLPLLIQLTQIARTQTQDPMQALPPISALLEHCQGHLMKLSMDPSESGKRMFGELRKTLSQVYEIAQNLQQQVEANIIRQQAELMNGDGAPPAQVVGETDMGRLAQMEKTRQDIASKQSAHEQAMKHREELHRQQMTLRDLETAAKISR